ncbi:MAG: hypothetical protein JSS49_13195 [Planctomycetes bacterium]|nr:hypothetical protein [Planctomycetota bacterium]
MSVRHWLCGFTLIASGTWCLADEPAKEPVLGRAEPIGILTVEIVHVQSPGHATHSAKALTAAEKAVVQCMIPGLLPVNPAVVQVGGSIAVVSQTASSGAAAPQPTGIIQRHLQQAVHLLDAAGLAEDAMKVNAILIGAESKLNEFEARHRDRLALAMKRAELEKLIRDIEHLNSRIASASEPLNGSEDEPVILPVDFQVPSVGSSLRPQ